MVVSDRVFQLIAEHTTDLVCIHDRENTIRFATPSSKTILGFSSSQIIGKKLTDFLAPEFVEEMDFSTLRRFFDHPGARIRYQVKHGENRLRWLESTFNKIEEGDDDYSILSSTRDITESVHLTDDLMTALSSEQQLSRFKANLYSVASHEFKTPLAVIQANIEMLRIKNSEKILTDSLSSMEEEVDRLNSMIADMLELKKLTTGKTTVKHAKVDIISIIDDIISKDCKKAYSKIDINLKVAGEVTEIMGDFSLIRYIFSNLMINACKFSNKNTAVNVSVFFEDKKVRVEIEDKGIGIPKEDQDSIFNSFFRAKNVSNIQGTGVGLSIVKEFVDLHKGKIYFLSTSGEGSTFFVELPYNIAI
jgi:PAS domain S-box-containing protein